MKFNKIFCTGARCGIKQSCERWTENLARHYDAKGLDWNHVVPVKEFADQAGNCKSYVPLEDEPIEPPAKKAKEPKGKSK